MKSKDRLLEYLKYKNIGQTKFEKSAGISRGYINNSKGSIGAYILEKIKIKYPELNITWLLTGEGYMLIESSIRELYTECMKTGASLYDTMVYKQDLTKYPIIEISQKVDDEKIKEFRVKINKLIFVLNTNSFFSNQYPLLNNVSSSTLILYEEFRRIEDELFNKTNITKETMPLSGKTLDLRNKIEQKLRNKQTEKQINSNDILIGDEQVNANRDEQINTLIYSLSKMADAHDRDSKNMERLITLLEDSGISTNENTKRANAPAKQSHGYTVDKQKNVDQNS